MRQTKDLVTSATHCDSLQSARTLRTYTPSADQTSHDGHSSTTLFCCIFVILSNKLPKNKVM